MTNEVDHILKQALLEATRHRPLESASPAVRAAYCRGVHDMAQMMAAMAVKTEQTAQDMPPNVQVMAKYFAQMIREMLAITNTLIPDGYEP